MIRAAVPFGLAEFPRPKALNCAINAINVCRNGPIMSVRTYNSMYIGTYTGFYTGFGRGLGDHCTVLCNDILYSQAVLVASLLVIVMPFLSGAYDPGSLK